MTKLERIKNFLLRIVCLDEFYYYQKGIKNKNLFLELKSKKKIFFMMTPTYGNLGDQAIEIASTEFLNDYFADYKLIKVHLEDTYNYMKAIEEVINFNDIVVLQGGGNFGSYYGDIEKKRRFIFSKLKEYKIISMPSSVIYEDTKIGMKTLEKTKKVLKKCNNTVLVSRDKFSYDFCRHAFSNCDNYLSPDMVMYLWKNNKNLQRIFNVICLRMDKEQKNNSLRIELIKELSNDTTVFFDTRVERMIPDEVKKEEVQAAINFFKGAKIVITDRLHAMIFSAITNTKCVAIPSLDNKIEGAYEWINNCGNIIFLENPSVELIKDSMHSLLDYKENIEMSNPLSERYDFLAKSIGYDRI